MRDVPCGTLVRGLDLLRLTNRPVGVFGNPNIKRLLMK
jgi:hypothetical protein